MPATALAVAEHYEKTYPGLLNGFVIDESDQASIEQFPLPTIATLSVMVSLEDRIALASRCIAFLDELAG